MATCRQCSEPIIGRTRGALYCGNACKERWHSEAGAAKARARRSGRRCAVCKGPIQSTSGKAQTCSRRCGIKRQNDKRQAARRAGWDADRPNCARCGERIPDSRRAGSLFCSPECKHLTQSARWRAKSPGYMRQYLYGITTDQYDALLAAQDNRCAICRVDTPGGKGWHVDHDHTTGAVRGLLCGHCNLGLGHFDDDAERLRAAIAYIT